MTQTVEYIKLTPMVANTTSYRVEIKPSGSPPVNFGIFNRIEIHHAVSIERDRLRNQIIKSPYEYGALTVNDAGDGILIISAPLSVTI